MIRDPAARYPIPWSTPVGLAIMIIAEIALAAGSRFVAVWLTPIMWTGYILTIDGVLQARNGRSWLLSRRREIPLLIMLSVGVWLVFEAYNFHLQNWRYEGVPTDPFVRGLGYFWSFATIMPGVFVTAELIQGLLPPARMMTVPSGATWPAFSFLAGLAMILVPLAIPQPVASFLFAPVWIGFFLLLEPANQALGASSVLRQRSAEKGSFALALLLGGFLCGFLWEAWNFQAFLAEGAYWIYMIPEPLRIFGWHFGQMPVLGLLGFPPFALELFAMYAFLRRMLGGNEMFGQNDWMN